MCEIVFAVEVDDGWRVATCHEPEMATQAESLEELGSMVRDLVNCRSDSSDHRRRWPIRLNFLHDPVLAGTSRFHKHGATNR